MATSIDNRDREQQMAKPADRLSYHVSFNDDQRQQQPPPPQRNSNINLDDPSSGSRQGLFRQRIIRMNYFSLITLSRGSVDY